nr:mitochondrial Rho GTPase 1-like [Tanacetum cinerariifolium]GEV89597.1 mitochondrial Rho GTPase 1-like [Tanacetum cinerariifolium]GEV91895.1 mitochondrial Rho GTPase 1-like [Tanacetum cinerariifolium]
MLWLSATCITVFANDSSNEASWIRAKELLVQVASHGNQVVMMFLVSSLQLKVTLHLIRKQLKSLLR